MPAKKQVKRTSKKSKSGFLEKLKTGKGLLGLVVVFFFVLIGAYYIFATHAASQPVAGIAALPDHSGYYLFENNGTVLLFNGSGASKGTLKANPVKTSQPIVDMALTKTGGGGWLLAADGGVFGWGNYGKFYGSEYHSGSTSYRAIVSTPSGAGYWIVTASGQVLAHGDATTTYKLDASKVTYSAGSYGSVSGVHEVVDADRDSSGHILNMLDRDGKIYSVGTRSIFKSVALHTGEAASAIDTHLAGYSYVAATTFGRISAFGGYSNVGDMYGKKLWGPVIGLAVFGTTGSHDMSYWMAGTDGGLFSYGQAGFHGSIATPQAASISLNASPSSILLGKTSTLSWTTANARSCSLNGVAVALAASSVQKPSSTTNYTLTCISNSNISASKSATVSVTQPAPPPAPPPPPRCTNNCGPITDPGSSLLTCQNILDRWNAMYSTELTARHRWSSDVAADAYYPTLDASQYVTTASNIINGIASLKDDLSNTARLTMATSGSLYAAVGCTRTIDSHISGVAASDYDSFSRNSVPALESDFSNWVDAIKAHSPCRDPKFIGPCVLGS